MYQKQNSDNWLEKTLHNLGRQVEKGASLIRYTLSNKRYKIDFHKNRIKKINEKLSYYYQQKNKVQADNNIRYQNKPSLGYEKWESYNKKVSPLIEQLQSQKKLEEKKIQQLTSPIPRKESLKIPSEEHKVELLNSSPKTSDKLKSTQSLEQELNPEIKQIQSKEIDSAPLSIEQKLIQNYGSNHKKDLHEALENYHSMSVEDKTKYKQHLAIVSKSEELGEHLPMFFQTVLKNIEELEKIPKTPPSNDSPSDALAYLYSVSPPEKRSDITEVLTHILANPNKFSPEAKISVQDTWDKIQLQKSKEIAQKFEELQKQAQKMKKKKKR